MWGYISFRALLALILSLVISAWFGEKFIKNLKTKEDNEQFEKNYRASINNNHDVSIGNSLSPTDKIQKLIRKYNEGLL